MRWYTFAAPDKRRPVLLLTRNSALSFLNGITVAPITTTVRNIPTEVLLTPAEDGTPQLCVINVDNLQTVQKAQLGSVLTTLTAQRMMEVEQAICFALGMDRFVGR